MTARMAQTQGLTPQQKKCVFFVGQGFSNHQIATRMVMQVKSVEHMMNLIYSKCGLVDDTQTSKRVVLALWINGIKA